MTQNCFCSWCEARGIYMVSHNILTLSYSQHRPQGKEVDSGPQWAKSHHLWNEGMILRVLDCDPWMAVYPTGKWVSCSFPHSQGTISLKHSIKTENPNRRLHPQRRFLPLQRKSSLLKILVTSHTTRVRVEFPSCRSPRFLRLSLTGDRVCSLCKAAS